MSLMNIAHCHHPGAARAALGLGPCPSSLCIRGPVASPCLCVSLLSFTRTPDIKFRAHLGNPAKTPLPNKVTFMAQEKPPVAISRISEWASAPACSHQVVVQSLQVHAGVAPERLGPGQRPLPFLCCWVQLGPLPPSLRPGPGLGLASLPRAATATSAFPRWPP